MALRVEDLERESLYRRYLEALDRYGEPEERAPSPGHAIRHCPTCGAHTMFSLDPNGTWYECTRCKHYA
ncbi:MAG: hypothetical protein LC722_03530 [Actinobacteria bacterium]|nr:hypothetical protein [Actinomycetota bacterium]